MTAIGDSVSANTTILRATMYRKDGNYMEVKRELVSQMVEKRKREEGEII